MAGGIPWDAPEADRTLDRQETCPTVKSSKPPKVEGQSGQDGSRSH